MTKRPESFNGMDMRFLIYKTPFYGDVALTPLDEGDKALLSKHIGRVVVLTMVNPLDKITASCDNCAKRSGCGRRRSKANGKYQAAGCGEWWNNRVDCKTRVMRVSPVLCPDCQSGMRKVVKTGEVYCPSCNPRGTK